MGFALSDMRLISAVFDSGGAIPARHGREGEDVSPALSWSDAPEGTRSFAVFCHDPDAPLITRRGTYGFVHWVCYNIPASADGLEEGVCGYAEGKNDFGESGYGGPRPPEGHGPHHYFFWLLALDVEPDLPDALGLYELLEKVEPHVLGMNRLVGTYRR